MAYLPTNPTIPSTYEQSIGFVCLDKTVPLTVHGVSSDRNCLYDSFSDEAKYYIINSQQTWLWGDGSSSTGSYPAHTYTRAGSYTVLCKVDISFRGGAVCSFEFSTDIIVPATTSDPVIVTSTISPPTGHPGGVAENISFTATNTGGRDAYVRPSIEKTGGTITDLTWITFNPIEQLLVHGGAPGTFVIKYDWSKVTSGTIDFRVKIDYAVIVSGYYLKYRNSNVTPA